MDKELFKTILILAPTFFILVYVFYLVHLLIFRYGPLLKKEDPDKYQESGFGTSFPGLQTSKNSIDIIREIKDSNNHSGELRKTASDLYMIYGRFFNNKNLSKSFLFGLLMGAFYLIYIFVIIILF